MAQPRSENRECDRCRETRRCRWISRIGGWLCRECADFERRF